METSAWSCRINVTAAIQTAFPPFMRPQERAAQAVEQHAEKNREHDHRENLFVMLDPELLDTSARYSTEAIPRGSDQRTNRTL